MDDEVYRVCREAVLHTDEPGTGLFAIALALHDVAYQLKYLGNGNAGTQMGAIENLAKEIKEGCELLAASRRR